jgi:CRP-like cAMP-binding protein
VSYDVTALLANHPLFRHLPEHERLDLAKNGNRKEFRSGELVFAKGDPAGAFYIVLKGRVLIGNYSVDGQKIIYDVLCSGDNFGEVSAIDGNARTADATTLEDSRTIDYPKECFSAVDYTEFRVRSQLIGDYL